MLRTRWDGQALLGSVEACEWDALARRRVLHFGYCFDYITRNVDLCKPLGPLPDFLQVGSLALRPVLRRSKTTLPIALYTFSCSNARLSIHAAPLRHLPVKAAALQPSMHPSTHGFTLPRMHPPPDHLPALSPTHIWIVHAAK